MAVQASRWSNGLMFEIPTRSWAARIEVRVRISSPICSRIAPALARPAYLGRSSSIHLLIVGGVGNLGGSPGFLGIALSHLRMASGEAFSSKANFFMSSRNRFMAGSREIIAPRGTLRRTTGGLTGGAAGGTGGWPGAAAGGSGTGEFAGREGAGGGVGGISPDFP